MRKESEQKEKETDYSLSTQEMIEDARARRKLRDQPLKCDQCTYTSTSITYLNKHKENVHDQIEKDIEMRPRYNCENCHFKTTSEYSLQKHVNDCQKKITTKMPKSTSSKRKACENCGKQFNKEHTLKKHLKTVHKIEF